MNKTVSLAFGASLILSLTTLNAQASLTVGTSDGKSVVYSSVSNITWTGDANLLKTLILDQGYNTVVNAIIAASPIITDTPNFFDGSYNNYDGGKALPYSGSYSISASDFTYPSIGSGIGRTTWFGAKAFINYLNNINYAGSNQWSLPSAGADPQTGYHAEGQFGQLFYTELGGIAGGPIPNTSNFSNEVLWHYWLATEDAIKPINSWDFAANNGLQYTGNKPIFSYAWAVSSGNLAAVPVPGAVWLFGSALLGLLVVNKRKTV